MYRVCVGVCVCVRECDREERIATKLGWTQGQVESLSSGSAIRGCRDNAQSSQFRVVAPNLLPLGPSSEGRAGVTFTDAILPVASFDLPTLLKGKPKKHIV